MSEKQLLGKVAMAAALGVTTRHSFVADPWAKMEAALSAGSKGGVVEVAGRQVEWQRDPTVRRPSAAVSRDAIEAFKAQFAARPTAGEDYLSRQEVADELGVRYGHPVIGEVWGHIREKMKGGAEAGTLSIGGRTVEWKCFYSARNVRLPYVSRAGLSAFKAEVGKLPGKAAPGQLPMSRLVEQIGCYLTNDVIVDFMARVKAEIAAGKTRGETPLHNGSVEWEMLKAVWGGSSKWGGVTPHFPVSSVPLFRKAIAAREASAPKAPLDEQPRSRIDLVQPGRGIGSLADEGTVTANGLPEVAIRRLLKNALDADIPDTDDEAYETVEPEVELELTISRPGGTRAVPVTVLAVPTATGNFLFEVFGVRHVVTPDRKVLRRFEIDGRAAWKESSRFAVDPGFVFPERQKAETPRPGAGPR